MGSGQLSSKSATPEPGSGYLKLASQYRDARLQKGEQLSCRRFLHDGRNSRQPLSSFLSEAVVKIDDLLVCHFHAAPVAFDLDS